MARLKYVDWRNIFEWSIIILVVVLIVFFRYDIAELLIDEPAGIIPDWPMNSDPSNGGLPIANEYYEPLAMFGYGL